MNHRAAAIRCAALLAALLAAASTAPLAHAQTDRIYFPAVHDVRSVLLARIRAETVRIDMAAWLLSERAISIALRDAFRRGVAVRLLGDRVSIFETDPNTRTEFFWLASQGIPIRIRTNPAWFPEIVHWKATIFRGQGLVAFGSANYTANQLAPVSAVNYSDETVLLSGDPTLVGAFLTKFDTMWADVQPEPRSRVPSAPYLMDWDRACANERACAAYRSSYPNPSPMRVDTSRLEPDRPMPPDLVWGQGPEFNQRLLREIARETRLVRLVTYRLTAADVTQALIDKLRSGVPVRLLVEPREYTNRAWPEFWLTHRNLDRLWAAGARIRQRRHAGLTHMKMLVTSAVATNASSNYAANWQRDHDYFVSASLKPAIHRAMRDRFDAMWNDTNAFGPFAPGPPDRPGLSAPRPYASGVAPNVSLEWRATPFATSFDLYLGTSPGTLSFVARIPALATDNPPATYSWTPPAPLGSGRTFFWKVVARTDASEQDPSLVADSGTWSFTTLGTPARGAPSQPGVFRRTTGQWFTMGRAALTFGNPGDVPVPADYDGDGTADAAVWRPSTGAWWIRRSRTASVEHVPWGVARSRDVPLPADYDGDGRADIAVWRPETATWYIRSTRTASPLVVPWGQAGDQPVPADYDGDGAADLALWRPATGTWWILTSGSGFSASQAWTMAWGNTTDVPVPADYDGDRRADIAVWRPETGQWWILRSVDDYAPATVIVARWGVGAKDDVPLAEDFDGDGRADLVVWRPGDASWFILQSLTGYATHRVVPYGDEAWGDVPLQAGWPAAQRYLRR